MALLFGDILVNFVIFITDDKNKQTNAKQLKQNINIYFLYPKEFRLKMGVHS